MIFHVYAANEAKAHFCERSYLYSNHHMPHADLIIRFFLQDGLLGRYILAFLFWNESLFARIAQKNHNILG